MSKITKIFNLMVLFFVLAFTWAFTFEIDQAVRAEAQVEPAKKIQKIQSRYPGTISAINYEVGDAVNKGDVVMELDIEEQKVLKASTLKRVDLIKEKMEMYRPLIEKGIEPKMTMITLQEQLIDLEEKIGKLDIQIRNANVLSNSTGVITAINKNGIGEVLSSGEILMEVVPSADYFIVKAKIHPKDIAKVSVGQRARVSYLAYDFAKYGVMPARIQKIVQNATESEDGQVYYEAEIRTDSDTFEKNNFKPVIIPGMQAQVDLLGDKRTIIEYVFNPIKRGMSKALTE